MRSGLVELVLVKVQPDDADGVTFDKPKATRSVTVIGVPSRIGSAPTVFWTLSV